MFEIHITGDENIHNAAKFLGFKTITVELLKPDNSVLRTEHMTSILDKFSPNARTAKLNALNIAKALAYRGVQVVRRKVEIPYSEELVPQSAYLEIHFVDNTFQFPLSRNIRKDYKLATARTYHYGHYNTYLSAFGKRGQAELCIFDDFVEEDKDWFNLYSTKENNNAFNSKVD